MLISVCMIAYNHEAYIREAIDGVLMQQTNFDVELIISDDCSTDKTHSLIIEYIQQHPKNERIKYFHQDPNLGMQSNFIFALYQCKGSFIALCEGDDYWTNPLKLQKQVDYISSHENCNLVFTDVKVLNENKSEFLPNWATIEKEKYEFKDLIERNVITTCSVLFRNLPKKTNISKYLLNFKIGDYPLYLFLVRSGYAYFLNEVTAVYRLHGGGVFSLSGPENFINANVEVLQKLQYLDLSEQNLFFVRRSLVKWHYTKAVRLSSKLLFNEVRSYIKKNLKFSDIKYNLKYFLLLIKMYLFPKSKKDVFTLSSTKHSS